MEEKIYHTWNTREYHDVETSVDWFWATGIIVLVSSILAIVFKNYLFAILIILGFGCIFYLKIRKPKEITITITNRAIKLGDEKIYYQDTRSFWIEYEKGNAEFYNVLLIMKRNFTPLMVIQVPRSVESEELRTNLLKHIEEKEVQNGKIYELMEKLGF